MLEEADSSFVPKKRGRPKKVEETLEQLPVEPAAPPEVDASVPFEWQERTWRLYWWCPSHETPQVPWIVKGQYRPWVLKTKPDKVMHPGCVVAYDDSDPRSVCHTVWKTLGDFQKNIGEGFIPNEAPLVRGARATVSGPGRG